MLRKLQGYLFCGRSSAIAVAHKDLLVRQNKKCVTVGHSCFFFTAATGFRKSADI